MGGSHAHFLLTRYNVWDPRFPAAAADLALDPDWLDHRTGLFERVCAPSVAVQTSLDFRWLIFVNPGTPSSVVDRIARAAPSADLVIGPWGTAESARAAIDERLPASTEWVLTSRLDNDDALARDYIERVAGHTKGRRQVLHIRRGYQVETATGRAVSLRLKTNPFLSLVEPVTDLTTAWGTEHNRASEAAPITEIGGPPGWLQLVHGENLANQRLPGRPVDRQEVLNRVHADPDVIGEYSAGERMAMWIHFVSRTSEHRLKRAAYVALQRGGRRWRTF